MHPSESPRKVKLKRGEQGRIARRLKVSETLVSQVKHGKTTFENETTANIRRAIAKSLGKSVGAVFRKAA